MNYTELSATARRQLCFFDTICTNTMLSFLTTINLDLQSILLIMGIVMNSILGILIFAHRRSEFVNRVYVFNIICIVWWSVMIVIYRLASAHLLAWTMGLYIAPTFIASSFLYFAFLFPQENARIPLRQVYVWLIAATNVAVVAMTVIPGLILVSVDFVPEGENIIHFGWLYIAYTLYISGFFGLGLLILARKMMLLQDKGQRRQLAFLLWGYLLASTFAMVTNLTLPYLGYFTFNWLGQVLTVFMVLPVTYAIFKHRLFDVKVIATEMISVVLWLFFLVRLLLDASPRERLIDGALFIILVAVGILLIRSVEREVAQRELIESQERELETVNRNQESLLHFISHEVKGYLTKNEAAFDAIRSGDFGEVTPQLHELSVSALADTRKGVDTVIDILDASNLKKGTVAYNKQPFDLVHTVDEIVTDLKKQAGEKGIELSFRKPVTGAYTFTGDEDKVRRHVFRNVIDNSIKYTPSGNIKVDLVRTPTLYRMTVTDTGVGITAEDMKHLFTEGGHGADSIKVNVHSTGYGLFIAKQVVEAHGGRAWAESEGAGKGSRFIIELPAA